MQQRLETLQIPTLSEQWSEAVQQWVLLIRDHVGADLYRLLECNFSTTIAIARTVSHVVMMDAFQKYFDYMMCGVCGIPEITLEGTVEDWRSIYERVQSMMQYELSWWTDRLLPICQEFIDTAAGKPSQVFWQAFYKPKSIYGGEVITGWLANLFPYLKHHVTHAASVKNPILSIDRIDLTVEDGISPQLLPSELSQVPFKLELRNQKNYSLVLVAGFIGISQSEEGSLQPEIGWAVLEQHERFAELLGKIEQEQITQPPIQFDKLRTRWSYFPKELIQLFSRFNGATLYAGSNHSWKIIGNEYRKTYDIPAYITPGYHSANHLIDLEDGRCVAFTRRCNKFDNTSWILLGKPIHQPFENKLFDRWLLEDISVIAEGIPQLFEHIFAAEGQYYFDAPEFVPIPINRAFRD